MVWVLWAGGCLDKNPVFVEETTTGGMIETMAPMSGSVTTANPTTDSNQTTESLPTTGSPDTEGTGPVDPGETTGDTEVSVTAVTSPGETTDISGSTLAPTVCGDGEVGPDEQCDDGNMSDNDDCLTDCVTNVCGDGIINDLAEQCDDGNNVKTDGCQPESCAVTLPRFVFVTSEVFSVDMLGGLLGADEHCNDLAQVAGLPGPYLAWLSDNQSSPSMRMNHYKVPYVNTHLEPIALDWVELASTMHKLPIDLDEKGAPAPQSFGSECGPNGVWTNTDEAGDGLGMDCGGWMMPLGMTTWGTTKPLANWSSECTDFLCHAQAPLFCVQQ